MYYKMVRKMTQFLYSRTLCLINFIYTGTFAYGCMPEPEFNAVPIISNPSFVPTAVGKIILNRHICKAADFEYYTRMINSEKFDLETATTVVNWRQ